LIIAAKYTVNLIHKLIKLVDGEVFIKLFCLSDTGEENKWFEMIVSCRDREFGA
jgi:hypothetical protein